MLTKVTTLLATATTVKVRCLIFTLNTTLHTKYYNFKNDNSLVLTI